MSVLLWSGSSSHAQEARWEFASATTGPSAAAVCAEGRRPVSGSAATAFPGAPGGILQETAPLAGGWRATMAPMPGLESLGGEVGLLRAAALCVADEEAACARSVQRTTPLAALSAAGALATCPAGSFALGGGARLTGDAQDVALTAVASVGLFAPTGIEARAEHRGPGAAGDWGLEVTATCVPASVLEVITRRTEPPRWLGSWAFAEVYPDVPAPYDWYGFYAAWPNEEGCPMPVSASALAGGDTVLSSTGVVDAEWFGRQFRVDHVFQSDQPCGGLGIPDPQGRCPDAPFRDAFFCAWPDDLDRALLQCGDDPPAPDTDRFRIGGRIVFGVADGSDGFLWVPGEGPVPVDPQPYREVFAATPIAVTTYADPRARDAWLDQVQAALTEEGTRWRRTDDPSHALDGDELLLVTPADELEAAAWVARNRDRLDPRRAPVVLFLERDGKAITQMQSW